MRTQRASTASFVGRGILAGVAGTAVMTAFQQFVEMPLTGRQPSYAPADFAERVLPVGTSTARGRARLNWATHFALGGMWGTAYGLVASAGLRGQQAALGVFGLVYTSDVALNTALGLYQPGAWTAQDWLVDVVDKLLQAEATGAIFDRFLDPVR
jgi:hypothetical protein